MTTETKAVELTNEMLRDVHEMADSVAVKGKFLREIIDELLRLRASPGSTPSALTEAGPVVDSRSLPPTTVDEAHAAEIYVTERTMHPRALPAGVLVGSDSNMRLAFTAGAKWQSLRTPSVSETAGEVCDVVGCLEPAERLMYLDGVRARMCIGHEKMRSAEQGGGDWPPDYVRRIDEFMTKQPDIEIFLEWAEARGQIKTALTSRTGLNRSGGEGWQKIESAPRDSRRVIIGWPGGGVRYAYFLDNSPVWSGWQVPSLELPLPSAPPTHWRPLPPPPQQDEG